MLLLKKNAVFYRLLKPFNKRALISNVLPDMFHYLEEPNIPATTNTIESFYSRLKADYRKHRGLTQKHKIHYLKWYCFFKNSNIN
jgi:hypothetical protein